MLFRLGLGALAALLVAASSIPAAAEWRRAESDRFIVYSDGRESDLRAYVQKLETFDRILRVRLNLPLDAAASRKLPIYLVGGRRALGEVFVDRERTTSGVYIATGEDIFATAARENGDDVMLHEYAHHFFFQHSNVAYPGWLVEGFAEYFMTARIEDGTVEVGHVNLNRAAWLRQGNWIPLEELLSKRPGEIRRSGHQATYYPVAWLLTHWFMSDAERRGQLQAYIDGVGAGGDPVTTMQAVTGLSLPELRRALRSYMSARLQMTRYSGTFPTAEMTISRLPPSADDLLLVGQRLKVGVPPDQRAATAAEVRQLAARHPDDPFAMLQLGHAELHFGDDEAGEAVLTRLLEREPDNVEALQLMATRHLFLAGQAEDGAIHMGRARAFLARAYAADDADYRTFILLGRTRENAPNYPNENDLLTWNLAYQLAPQLAAARLGYASALMRSDEFEQAAVLLRPLANAPHGGATVGAAQMLLNLAEAGRAPLSDAEIQQAVEREEAAPPEPEPEPAPEEGAGESGGEEEQADEADEAAPA